MAPRRSTADHEFADLPSLAPQPTAAERAAQVIRENIFEGKFAPGTPLPEAALAQALQVSRNTVREALRTLMGEHLLVHEVYKGVSVRWLTPTDVREIYALRRMFELSAIDLILAGQGTVDTDALGDSVAAGLQAVEEGRWRDVGTENLRYHATIVAVHTNTRLSEFLRRLMTELRIGFLAIPDQAAFHHPFLERDSEMHRLLVANRIADVRDELAQYLDDAERPVVAAIEQRTRVT